jgi:mitochondrial fission protein ELM1
LKGAWKHASLAVAVRDRAWDRTCAAIAFVPTIRLRFNKVSQPRIWLLLGHKKGDNGQVETIAAAIEASLGWCCERKHIQVREPFLFGKPKVGPTLYHLDREASDALEAPWPDLIITIGRSPANVALWIEERSRGKSRIALVGKPSGYTERFDLVVTSGEILPVPYPNVLRIKMPLMRIDRSAIEREGRNWEERLASLPRPLVGIMIGGPTNPFVFNRLVTDRLVEEGERIIAHGGTPYFTTSRRTPAGVAAQIEARLGGRCKLYDWNDSKADNPYRGLLGLADSFVVTGDSISMMVEVVQLGKPLQILSLPTGLLGSLDQARRSLARGLFQPAGPGAVSRMRVHLAHVIYRAHLIRHTRDYPGFHRWLVAQGLAGWVGDPVTPLFGRLPDDIPKVVAALEALVGR